MTLNTHDDERELAQLVERIRVERGFDAGVYKRSFLRRRVAVRLRAREVDSYRAYARLLEAEPGEYDALLAALEVTLTGFFRDPGAHRALAERVLAPLVQARAAAGRRRLRVWSAGCATGEEPYSVAIALLELLGQARRQWHIDIQATDIDDEALHQARAARYGEFSLRGMEPALRSRYCLCSGNTYRLVPDVTDMVRFQRLDLLRDAFPQRVDVILCRNVLIYFARAEQAGIFERFHASLRPGGALLLGRAEIPPRATRALFAALDAQEHLYTRLPAAARDAGTVLESQRRRA